jgi:excisionase family DNA binding protein
MTGDGHDACRTDGTALSADDVVATVGGIRTIGKMLSIDDVAASVGLKHRAVRRAIQAGELRAYKLRGRVRVDAVDLAAWKTAFVVAPADALTASRRAAS